MGVSIVCFVGETEVVGFVFGELVFRFLKRVLGVKLVFVVFFGSR